MKRDTHAGLACAVVIHGILIAFLCNHSGIDPTVLALEVAPVSVSLEMTDALPAPAFVAPLPIAPPSPPQPASTPEPISPAATEPLPDQRILPSEPLPALASIIDSPIPAHQPDSAPSHPRTHKPSHTLKAKSTGRIAETAPSGAAAPGAGVPSGGGSSGNGSTARYRINPQPEYPSDARRSGEKGVVLLDVTVAANGRVSNVTIIRSTGFPSLDHAAVEAVREWLFDPARAAGVAVESHVKIPVRFSLTS